ncbi:MAG: DUF1501 domain-containing protein [Pirellulales bacterium]|nr:DUF1501 domain-containing protein [Pirellulales bacterium]
MSLQLAHHVHAAVNRWGVIGRRHFLRNLAAGAASLGLVDRLALQADELRRQGKACILLWMQGGPSQFETWDPKPGHGNGGETKAIDTSVPGIQVAENLPRLAAVAHELAIIRSMSTREGNHQRASFLMHTAHVPVASVQYPAMGSVVWKELGSPDCQLPSFVRVGRRFPNSSDGGLLGTDYNAFLVPQAGRLPENVQLTTDQARFQRRLALIDRLEAATTGAEAELVASHRGLYRKASQMVLSPQMKAFDLGQEPDAVRQRYGESEFAAGCLLARRLVEAGVVFVEVGLGNWDTHDNNFERSRDLTAQLDQPFACLLQDLRERGLLDRTLVVWMGEFGRTPRINPRAGRDHYPRAFSAVLAGSGIRGGQVIGRTSAGGEDVVDRPVSAQDLFRTVYAALGIDADKENMSSIGRPIKIVEGGAVVQEALA